MKQPSEAALKLADSVWDTVNAATKTHLEYEPSIFKAFACIIDELWAQANLGNATTGELLDEIRARVDTTYSTVRGSQRQPMPTSGHSFLKHDNCRKVNCEICDGGLAFCVLCGEAENTLADVCPRNIIK